jgi:signal transduction histidine kinase
VTTTGRKAALRQEPGWTAENSGWTAESSLAPASGGASSSAAAVPNLVGPASAGFSPAGPAADRPPLPPLPPREWFETPVPAADPAAAVASAPPIPSVAPIPPVGAVGPGGPAGSAGLLGPVAREVEATVKPVPPLIRPLDGRIVAGISAGVSLHLRLPVLWVRLTFALLALIGGVGVLMYAMLWIFVPQSTASSSLPVQSEKERRQALGIAALGAALAVLGVALGFGQSIGWIVGPLGLAAIGGAFIWREADDAKRERWRRSAAGVVGGGSGAAWRVVGGVTLVVGGLAVFALAQFNFGAAGGALLAVVLTLVGVAIIAVPWWIRLVRDLGAERREAVAQQERAEIAAHLHDSVLQTLALIQRQAADPREVLRLSRSQERELRSWLYGPAGYATPASLDGKAVSATLATAFAAAAGEVEDTYAVQVTPIVVGDCPLSSDLNALVAASREAMVNAAKHARAPDISLYAEVEDAAVTVFIRDRGIGFNPDQVDGDRRGLADSVRGRMRRHGGTAIIRSRPGDGTEVELRMPLHHATAASAGDQPSETTTGGIPS